MRFAILGPLRLQNHAGPVPMPSAKRRALLIALLVRIGTEVPACVLVDWLWPHDPPRSAMATLQAHVSALRRTLEPDRPPWAPSRVLVTRPSGYLLSVQPDMVDARRFEDLLTRGAAALRHGGAAAASQLLHGAIGVWRGEALFDVRHVEAAQGDIARLEELRLTAVALRVQADLALRRYLEVVPELARLVQEHPLDERFYAQLMVALSGSGRRADAMRVYRRASDVLARELGIEPGPALQRIRESIAAGRPPPHPVGGS